MNNLFPASYLKQFSIVDYGYTKSAIPSSFSQYEKWIKRGEHGGLTYLEGHRLDLRASVKNIYPDFESSLVFIFSYQDERIALNNYYNSRGKKRMPKISSYVFASNGLDYHYVLKNNLVKIGEYLRIQFPGLEYKVCLDVHPVLERDLAYRAGLGWFGKNSMLISKEQGSFNMIGSLLLNQEIPSESEASSLDVDHCGSCTACIDICPTKAIDESNRTLVANKCISSFSIEVFKEESAPLGMEKSEGEIFGCDLCQDICPWNKKWERNNLKKEAEIFSSPQAKLLKDFFLDKDFLEIKVELEKMSNREFKRKFSKTPLERTGRVGLLKNLSIYL